MVKEQGLGDHLSLPHGGHERPDYGALVMVEREVAEDIPPRVIILQGELMGHLLGIGERDLVHEVPMPETVRVVPCIER